MKIYNSVIIGFGKGGKTLAAALAANGEKVAVIESSSKMYGGTCINVGCIPTKSLVADSELSLINGGNFETKSTNYRNAIKAKEKLTSMLRQKNYNKLSALSNVDIIDGFASFIDEHTLQIKTNSNETLLKSEKIFINTGAESIIPNISGIQNSKNIYFSDQLLELQTLPKQLVIIGGGYIGIEFASMYANFGSQVTIIQDLTEFMPREDKEISNFVLNALENKGIKLLRHTTVTKIQDIDNQAHLSLLVNNQATTLLADAVLIATGRKPNIDKLQLAKANIDITERGAIKVNEHLQTSQPHIYALGDVTGSLQFTYISLDDYRIVLAHLQKNNLRTTNNRGVIPYSVFIDPPFSRVGLTEAEAISAGYKIRVAQLLTSALPKAQVLRKPTGLFKAIIDAQTDKILGAHIFAVESYEVINIIKLAMDNNITYQTLRDNIYTHPTMSEALNDLFADSSFI